MSIFYRRRAERFAQLLDESSDARRRDPQSTDDELSTLVDVGHRLSRMHLKAQADPEFRTDLRTMLMAAIEREGIGASAVESDLAPAPVRRAMRARSILTWAPIRSRRARGAVVVGLAVGTFAVAGLSAISGDAKPGDPLYGMKRSAERAQLALSSSQAGRGQLYLEFAKTRVDEAAAGRGDLVAVLTEMDDETRQGVRLLTTDAVTRHDPAPLDTIDTFVAGQRHTLAGVLGTLTGRARGRMVDSLQLLDQVNTRVGGLRTSLSCADIARSAGDELGPVPGGCAPADSSTDSVVKAPANGAPTGGDTTTAPQSGVGAGASAATSGGAAMTRPATPGSVSSSPQGVQQPDNGLLDRIARLLGMG